MGLEILEPGCSKVKVTPHKTDFDYKAVYPAPQGAITVEDKGGTITVEGPEGIEIIQ